MFISCSYNLFFHCMCYSLLRDRLISSYKNVLKLCHSAVMMGQAVSVPYKEFRCNGSLDWILLVSARPWMFFCLVLVSAGTKWIFIVVSGTMLYFAFRRNVINTLMHLWLLCSAAQDQRHFIFSYCRAISSLHSFLVTADLTDYSK